MPPRTQQLSSWKLAFTVGSDVYFADGRYDPSSVPGRELLAHELTHVMQQSGQHAAPLMIQRQVAPLPSVSSPPSPGPTSEDFASGEPAWIAPPRLREGARPVYDEETRAVIAFRYSSGGYYEVYDLEVPLEVYDLEGNLVDRGERGIESPLIDPIDIFAGGLVGLGRSLLGGSVRAGARGLAAAAAEEGGAVAARGGLRAAAATLSAQALAAVRAGWRTIRVGGALNFAETAGAHMAGAGRRVPLHILRLAIRWGTRTADPEGVAGAFRYVIPMFKGARDQAGRWIYK